MSRSIQHEEKIGRREMLKLAGGIGLGSALALSNQAEVQAARVIDPRLLQLGDVFLARYNSWQPWGTWRHAGIWDGNGIVEGGWGSSSSTPSEGTFNAVLDGYVVRRDLYVFCRAYTYVRVLRLITNSRVYGISMAGYATGRLWYGGFTCVELVNKAYRYATRYDYNWTVPDDLARSPLFYQYANLA